MRSDPSIGFLDELKATLLNLQATEPRGGRFVAERISSRPWVRLAVGADGLAALLPPVADGIWAPIELMHLRMRFNVNCTLETSQGVVDDTLVIVQCLSHEPSIEKAFLQALSVVLPAGDHVTTSEIDESIRSFIELFRTLQSPAAGSVVGLWGELFVLSESSDIEVAADGWHALPTERFDFGLDALRVEVKTSLRTVRTHEFSLEQVRPPKGTRVTVASLLTAPFVGGPSLAELLSRVCGLLDPPRASRVTIIAMQTLGRDWDVGKESTFDEQLARGTLAWYAGDDIPAVSAMDTAVSEVRFRSDLTGVRALSPSEVRQQGKLTTALVGTFRR